MSDEFLSSIGLQFKELAIGLQGGISAVFLLRKPKPWSICGSVIIGMFTANHFGSSFASFPWNPLSYNATVYAVGVCGSSVCLGLIKIVNWYVKRLIK